MTRHEERMEESRWLSGMLIRVSERAKEDFAATAREFGLPVPLARAVLLLGAPAPMRDLADHLDCDRSYVTSLADQLESRGLITRVPGADRRVKLLQLTDAGVALRAQLSEDVAQRALVLRRLNDDERRALAPLLERLLQADD